MLLWILIVVMQVGAPVRVIVTGANVRLRAEPKVTAPEVARLALGTVVDQLETSQDGGWRRIAAPNGQSGWISSTFIGSIDSKNPLETYKRLAEDRLKLTTATFSDRMELVRFLERVIKETPGPELASLQLLRLTALNDSAGDIHRFEPKDPVEQAWLDEHRDELAFSEPAGQWLLQSDLYWKLEEKYRGNAIAEAIAWAGAENGLPGECEGYIPCDLTVMLLTDARYINLYPAGLHVDQALNAITYLLSEMLKPNSPYTAEAGDRPQLEKDTAALIAILDKLRTPRKTQVIGQLRKLVEQYGSGK